MEHRNTRMTAPNTFTKGLVMDFNPTITKADVLVNALNATLLTFNGNEMQLQQDMGNGRVETAYLPEGYIPVGACEYGDIIYIVSYNPLENKSQIGCFPSPERNISSEELGGLNQSLQPSDFQNFNGSTPTGVLVTTSVKKIVYDNKNMNPGDKYIIYTTKEQANEDTLSDYANTSHTHNTWPKLLKLSVVSIEDSGKIVDLNAAVKWYDEDYYIPYMANAASSSKPDLDSYRSLVSSAYSVFQSKVSGKLAILAELETIEGFSCTYDVYVSTAEDSSENLFSTYHIYFYTAWDTSHYDINPSGFIFTKSAWTTAANGGCILMPVLDGSTVTYQVQDATTLPLEAACTVDADTGLVTSYNAKAMIPYTRTYELENPSKDFSTYQTEESLYALIDDIVNWEKIDSETYGAVKESTAISNLRTVTKVTRIVDLSSGEPYSGNDAWYYVYNLDSYSFNTDSSENGTSIYQTKGIDGTLINLTPIVLNDDVVNNYFKKDIPKLVVSDFTLQRNVALEVDDSSTVPIETDLSNMIWNYEVAPAMPYGVLDYLAISGSIDFSKIGSGEIDLTTWRYYVSGSVATLTWGLDAYTEPNRGIAEVTLDFYDNQGLAASYHVTGKSSYAGTFTESIVLGQQNSSYKLDAIDAYGNTYIHAGTEDSSGTVYLTDGNAPTTTETDYGPYLDDAGTLYANILYLVRITVKYCTKDILGNYNTDNTASYKTFYRWMWTNGMFNDSYYSVSDFDTLNPRLSLDFSASFDTRGNGETNTLSPKYTTYMNENTINYSATDNGADNYLTLGAYVYHINQSGEDDDTGNILLTLEPGLSEGYNTFNLNEDALDEIGKIVSITMGNSSITKSVDAPSLIYSDNELSYSTDANLQPVIATYLCSHDTDGVDRSGYVGYSYGVNNCIVGSYLQSCLGEAYDSGELKSGTYLSDVDSDVQATTGSTSDELYGGKDNYSAYIDAFSLNLVGAEFEADTSYTYYDSDGNTVTLDHYQQINTSLKSVRDDGVALTLTGIMFSKLYTAVLSQDSDSKVLVSMISDSESESVDEINPNSADMVGLHYYKGHLYFDEVITWHMGESGGKKTRWGSYYSDSITNNTWLGKSIDGTANSSHDEWRPKFTHEQVQELWKQYLSRPIAAFMICRSGSSNGNISYTFSDVSWKDIRSSFGVTVSNATRIHENKATCPHQNPENWDSDDVLIHSFMVKDTSTSYVTPVADYFIGTANSSSGTQDSRKATLSDTPCQTLADMLGSLFIQLYVLDENASSDYTLWSNIVTLSDYNEYWNKDIIVKMDTDSLNSDSSDSNLLWDLITIQTQTTTDYLKYLSANSEGSLGIDALNSDEVNLANVTYVLYGIERTINFQFTVAYNLGNMEYTYSQKATSSNLIKLATLSSESDTAETATFSSSVTANTLYTWTGSDIIQFGSGSSIKYAESFTQKDGYLYAVLGDSPTSMKSSAFATIAKVLKYDSGEIYFENLDQFSTYESTYDIRYEGTGDDPYLKSLPNISFFRLYNPGS